MLLLITLSLIGAAVSEPQAILPMGYSIMSPGMAPSILPISYGQIPSGQIHAIPATFPAFSSPLGHNIIYPSVDVSMGRSSSLVDKPMEETMEMKKAKMDFEMAYNKAMMTPPESTPVVRARRDSTRVLPYGYNLPYSGYMTPYSQMAPSVQLPSVLPQSMYQSPYVSQA